MKYIVTTVLTTFVFVACIGPDYEKDDAVAKLKGEEIKVEDILW